MSRQIRVGDRIQFVGSANSGLTGGHMGNVDGKMHESMFHRLWDFEEDTMNADPWLTSVGNGGAVAITVAANGVLRLTANTGADDNVAEVEGEAIWYAQQAMCMEARVKVDAITTVGICVGLVDDYINTNDQIKFEISGTTIVDRGTTPDAVAWVFDTDADTDKWYCCNSKAGTQAGTLAVSSIAPVNATYEVLRIEVDSSGNAAFYRNRKLEHVKASAVTAAHAYRPYAGVITRTSGAARNLDIDYIECWQNRLESSTVLN